MERERMNPREKAELALDWARVHIANPCGETPEEREYMRRTHQNAVRGALEEPGVVDLLTPEEKEELFDLLGGESGKLISGP